MKRNWFIRNLHLLVALYFGWSLAYYGINYDMVEFWVVVIPVLSGYTIWHALNQDNKERSWFIRNLDLFIAAYFGISLHYAGVGNLELWFIVIPVMSGYLIWHFLNKEN